MKDIFTIKNCKIVNEGDIFEGDVLVKEGRFLKIGSDIESQGETIDAAGLFLFPGVIDDQVHFRTWSYRKRKYQNRISLGCRWRYHFVYGYA